MGIRIRKPALQAITSTEHFSFICPTDSAIDASKSDVDKYMERLEEHHLVFHPDEHPTRFVFHALSRSDFRAATRKAYAAAESADGRVSNTLYQLEVTDECFRRGVVRVEDLEVEAPDGSLERITTDDASFALLQLPERVIAEVGRAILSKTDTPIETTPSRDVPK